MSQKADRASYQMINKKNKVLVTGAKGFVGKFLVKFLKKKNIKVISHDKKVIDLSKKLLVKKYLKEKQPNTIVHLASRTVSECKSKKEDKLQYENTFLPTKNIIDNAKFCHSLKKIIFVGSIEEYGSAKLPYRENSVELPTSSYGMCKLRAMRYVNKERKKINAKIDILWLRPSLMFGFGDSSRRFMGGMLFKIKNYKKKIINVGSQKRDYLYVKDFCKFIYFLISKKNISNKLFILNVSGENWVKLKNVLKFIIKNVKKKYQKNIRITHKSDKSKLLSSGKLIKKNYPKFKFTKFEKSLKTTIRDYEL
jgi:nucleoside-diphosphate-sugar epimerase